jgi:hypothetical protein
MTRDTPSAFGLAHVVVDAVGAGAAAGAAIGAAAGACAVCAQALVAADTEIARAIAKALRITFSILKNAHLFIFIATLNFQVNVRLGYHRNANIYWSGMVNVAVCLKNTTLPRPVFRPISTDTREFRRPTMAATMFPATLSRPLALAAIVVVLLLGATLGLWAYYGTAIFFEMLRAGWAACF